MYESHFQFRERPFGAPPSVAGFVSIGPVEAARQSLARCVERAEGIGLVIGAAGTGKTLVCRLLADEFRRQQFQVAMLASARLHTRRALLQNILFELNLPHRSMEDEELRLSLIDHLQPRSGGTPPLLLIVDEAHTLPPRLLEEIRVISNGPGDGEPRIRLVLAGGLAMEERLANPKLDSLAQRVAVRAYLAPLNREETGQYVREQLRRVGADPEQIAGEDVLRAIHQATDGVPRLINQVCDHALLLAMANGEQALSAARVEEAWADLQQLPTPWHGPEAAPPAPATSAIEFGQLSDEASSPPASAPAVDESIGSQALAQLEAIDERIETLEGGSIDAAATSATGPEAEFSPLCGGGTEVELALAGGQDLFGSGFEEEEVIIDRYASMEARPRPQRSKVESVEGRILGNALSALGQQAAVEDPAPRPALNACAEAPLPVPAEEFCPADDPVLPEPAADAASRERPLVLSASPNDDRDLILLENAKPREPEAKVDAPNGKREYRRLFSTLRKG